MNAEIPSRYQRVGLTAVGFRPAKAKDAKVEPTFNFGVDDVSGLTLLPHAKNTRAPLANRSRIGILSYFYIVLAVVGSFVLLTYYLALVGVHRGIWTASELNTAVHKDAYIHVTTWSASMWDFSGMLCGMTLVIGIIRRIARRGSNHYFIAAFIVQLVPWIDLFAYRH